MSALLSIKRLDGRVRGESARREYVRADSLLVGRRFGRLTARDIVGRVGVRQNVYRCECDCGGELTTIAGSLRSGKALSCGCLRLERLRARCVKNPVGNKDPFYTCWRNMISRCTNTKAVGYPNYGGRGITICDRWMNFSNFYADMSPRPAWGTIERIDTNGNYEPSNCTWATRREQSLNKRRTIMVPFGVGLVPLAIACDVLGFDYMHIYQRMLKRSFTEAVDFKPKSRSPGKSAVARASE